MQQGQPCKITVTGGPPELMAVGVKLLHDVMQNGAQKLHSGEMNHVREGMELGLGLGLGYG